MRASLIIVCCHFHHEEVTFIPHKFGKTCVLQDDLSCLSILLINVLGLCITYSVVFRVYVYGCMFMPVNCTDCIDNYN